MSAELQAIQGQLSDAIERIVRLEARVEELRWRHLMRRPHAWRKQLYIKGRNMTVGQLASAVFANKLTPEQAGYEFDLPVEAIKEALAYYEENKALIQAEAAEERRYLAEKGIALEPQHLPR